ncbi:hypothetical protein Forpe1208_v011892 [Fusarium oxysporum f. sp. rapae]|uniref:Uncharacterized protein n=1 Tax=Fusarium oxysporum f. sp. rapae TaxID=485398 RepID=A0A8J5NPD6_FUSOX|nr:hypothetical protein Forpe1208_v012476 [Fusarium oxysporum f. sp. rapae]KAG7408833.1 hypothetical protein Forpe1208_v011892 [Fusarium oxysporum f. sp. rapae]
MNDVNDICVNTSPNMTVTTRSQSVRGSSTSMILSSAPRTTLSAPPHSKSENLETNRVLYNEAAHLAWEETEAYFKMICTQRTQLGLAGAAWKKV